ncbi:MAG TPA: hypothetical protein VFX79_03180 [Candidatus Saccharimonadales bacterium]|nr:hypothetical protein [Candidatus Saccharimonadales bacterium]
MIMGRNLEFGIEVGETTTLSVSGPSSPLRRAGRYRELVKAANPQKPFHYDETKSGTKGSDGIGEVQVNVRKAASIDNNRQRNRVLAGVLDYLHFLGSGQADWLEADPQCQMREGILRPWASEDGLAVIIKSPDMSDPQALEELALRGMAGMATDLAYRGRIGDPRKKVESELAHTLDASISPNEGVTLTADTAAQASLSTVDDYDPESGFVYLHARNLERSEQSLICLAGAIELAQANR